MVPTAALAEPAAPAAHAAEPVATSSIPADEVKESRLDSKTIWSYFSAGLLLSYFRRDEIEAAEVRDGVVRVLKRRNFAAGVGLQAYYPFPFATFTYARRSNENAKWTKYSETSFGPYVGAALSSDSIIDMISLGVAYSSQRKEGGIRIGVGAVANPRAQHLAPDFQENMAAPMTTNADGTKVVATDIKYVQENAFGFQVMLTFTPGLGD
jgi:hypothetical protein